ncbi:MAG: tetratricopeptide repeat protein [Isosphaeraceae bacterium]
MDNEAAPTAGVRREGDALVNARHRIALLAETVGTRHPEYATGLNQLALLLIMQGDPAAAEPYLREALDVRRDALGESHPDYATNLSSLGGLLWARGAVDEAEPLLRRAAEIRMSTLGASHPKTVVSLNSLEQLLQAREGPPITSVRPPGNAPVSASPGDAELAGWADSTVAPESIPVVSGPPELASILPFSAAGEASPRPGDRETKPETPTLSDAESLLPRLAAEFSRLGDRFLESGRQLLSEGRLPSEELIADARAARHDFEKLQGLLRGIASTLGLFEYASSDNLSALSESLPDLHAAVALRRSWVQQRQGAVALLRQVEHLGFAGEPHFEPLTACQSQARSLRETIGGLGLDGQPDIVRALLDGEHPLAAFLQLATAGDEVDDHHWSVAFERVEAEFGPALAVAAARSRIRPVAH